MQRESLLLGRLSRISPSETSNEIVSCRIKSLTEIAQRSLMNLSVTLYSW